MTIEEKIAAANAKLADETEFVETRVAEAEKLGHCPCLASETAMKVYCTGVEDGPTPAQVMAEIAAQADPAP